MHNQLYIVFLVTIISISNAIAAEPDHPKIPEYLNHTIGVQAFESFSGKDHSGKNGVMTKLGLDLILLFHEHRDYQTRGGFNVIKKHFKPSNKLIRLKSEKVVIDVAATSDANALSKALEKLGMENISVYGRMISGLMPVASLEKLAALSTLKFARPALAKSSSGLVTSQGDIAQLSDQARSLYAVNGSGIVIGTLSDSYDCRGEAAADVISNDLPANIMLLADETGCASGSDEGRAMMQIIHDSAPGAAQAFHTAFDGMASFASGIIDLANIAAADIINDDVIYFAEPMFQDGIIAQAIDTVKANGTAYFSAAGNQSNQSYEAPFISSGVSGYAAGSIRHDFDTATGVDSLMQVTIPGNTQVIFVLQWDDPFFSVSGSPGADTDMDIILYTNKGKGRATAGGIAANIGGDAVEIFAYSSSATTTSYQIGIEHVAGPAPGRVKLVYFGSMTVDEFATNSSTSYGHPIAAGGQAIAAARYTNTPAYGVSPPIIESFSSKGGTPILFDSSGNPVTELRQKPDFTAPNGGDTTFFGSDYEGNGFPNFFGTSAAAPHAAAMAALIKQFDNTLSPDGIYATMQNTAIDMQSAGFDYKTGHGLIQASLALASLDTDGDIIANTVDNCPAIANQDQANNDNDSLGDACDTDDDNDGLLDADELIWMTDPFIADSDSDGLNDGDEVSIHLTLPTHSDTDGDGLNDGDEIIYAYDPLLSNKGDLAPRNLHDNNINVGDLVVLSRLVHEQITATGAESILADMNDDGTLNVVDILLLTKLLQ